MNETTLTPMMNPASGRAMAESRFSYQACLAASESVNWRVEDLIGDDKTMDWSKPFLPESLARVRALTFLSDDERRTLNQIRGHGYLYTFGLVEEFILPFVLDHARPDLGGDDYRTRAFLQFASEEAKHIHLFKRFREEFLKGFETPCDVIGPPEEIARAVLAQHPLSVALLILHIEWMTQRHYVDSVRDNQELDPQFKSLLKHHWMEEAQHAKLDTLMVETIARNSTQDEIDNAVAGYLELGVMLDEGLAQQAKFDLEALQKASGRTLSSKEQEEVLRVQHQALRWTFIGTGMTHKNFLATVETMDPQGRKTLEETAPAFC